MSTTSAKLTKDMNRPRTISHWVNKYRYWVGYITSDYIALIYDSHYITCIHYSEEFAKAMRGIPACIFIQSLCKATDILLFPMCCYDFKNLPANVLKLANCATNMSNKHQHRFGKPGVFQSGEIDWSKRTEGKIIGSHWIQNLHGFANITCGHFWDELVKPFQKYLVPNATNIALYRVIRR